MVRGAFHFEMTLLTNVKLFSIAETGCSYIGKFQDEYTTWLEVDYIANYHFHISYAHSIPRNPCVQYTDDG